MGKIPARYFALSGGADLYCGIPDDVLSRSVELIGFSQVMVFQVLYLDYVYLDYGPERRIMIRIESTGLL